MRPNTYDDTKAYCLCKVLVPDEITCFSQDVQLLSACSDKFLGVHMNDRIFANQNTENPQIFTIQSHQYPNMQNMAPDIRITFYDEERKAYICFNQKWQPRLMRKRNLRDERMCHFREHMDHGYFTFSSVHDPQKYLAFNKNGRPVNYAAATNAKNDEKCRRIFKRITRESSNNDIGNMSTDMYQETSSAAPSARKQQSSSRMNHKTHSKKVDTSKPRSTSSSTSTSTRAKTHPVRHHHDKQPLRHNNPHHQQQQQQQQQQHNINNDNNLNLNPNNIDNNNNFNNINDNNNNSNNNNNNNNNNNDEVDRYNNMSSSNTKQLDNEMNLNAIYNNPSNNVNSNNISDNNNDKVTTHPLRHHRRKQHHHQQTFSRSPLNSDMQENVRSNNNNNNNENWNRDEMDTATNNNNNNCTSDDSDADKHLRGGKKIVRGRNNAHANEKQQNNKCNNRKNKKNNENVKPNARKLSQKTSHKTNRNPEN